METKVFIDLYKNKNLLEAFALRSKKQFEYWLAAGANPAKKVDPSAHVSTFEYLCKYQDSTYYLAKCLEYKTDPNERNSHTGQHPIHIAVQNLCVQNIELLLKADPYCANQTLNFDKTPLHLLTEVMDDNNSRTVFDVIRLFSEFGGSFTWPARKSDQKTPFQMLLEKMAKLLNKAICLQIIRFLIARHPKIDKFQRKECADLIKEHFGELVEEYQAIASWSEEPHDGMDWTTSLEKLMLEDEADFLVKFDSMQNFNKEELEEYLYEGTLFIESIKLNRFESFVAIISICGTDFRNISLKDAVAKMLDMHRYKFIKHIFDLNTIARIHPEWMVDILWKMEDKENDMDPNILKCFHILLDHPKYDMNEPILEMGNTRAITLAAYQSNYAMVEMLRRGAVLDSNNEDLQTIQFIDSNALKQLFDSCITKCIASNPSNQDYYMAIDYSFLRASMEMPTIEYLAQSRDLRPLISHPVVASFLFLKLLRLANLFYLNLFLFTINAISFSVFMCVHFMYGDDQEETSSTWLQVWKTLAYGSLIVFSSKEAIQLIGSPKSYLKSVANYFEIGLICLMVTVLFIPIPDQETRCNIAAILYLVFAIEWTLIFSTLPMFSGSNYIAILKKVALNFLRMLAFYSIILLAFAVSFYTLVNDSKDVTDSSTMSGYEQTKNGTETGTPEFVQMMMAGDFGSMMDRPRHFIIGCILLVIFVLFVTIVLMSLLVGLSVSDTSAIEEEAERNKWAERTKLLAKYEVLTFVGLKVLKSLGLTKQILSLLNLMPLYLPMDNIKIEIGSKTSNQWIYVPGKEVPNKDETNDKGEVIERDIVGDPLPLIDVKSKALSRVYFGCWKIPVRMDKRIIESGLKVLKSNQQMKVKKELELKEMVNHEEMKRQQRLIMEQIIKH